MIGSGRPFAFSDDSPQDPQAEASFSTNDLTFHVGNLFNKDPYYDQAAIYSTLAHEMTHAYQSIIREPSSLLTLNAEAQADIVAAMVNTTFGDNYDRTRLVYPNPVGVQANYKAVLDYWLKGQRPFYIYSDLINDYGAGSRPGPQYVAKGEPLLPVSASDQFFTDMSGCPLYN